MTSSATLALNVTSFFETLPKGWTSKIATDTTGEVSAGGTFKPRIAQAAFSTILVSCG